MSNCIDHLVIGAESLPRGEADLQSLLGVTVPGGSKHTTMSTHNLMAQSGNGTFLEIIAIDPEAPAADRPRWFGLDEADVREALVKRTRPLTWTVGTTDIKGTVEASPVDLGEIVQFSRGERTWELTVPADGGLVEGGVVPTFIEWSAGPHVSTALKDVGLTLREIRLITPEPDRVHDILATLKVDHLATVVHGLRAIEFVIDSPEGAVVIS